MKCKTCGADIVEGSISHLCNGQQVDHSGDFFTSMVIAEITDNALLGGLMGGDMMGGIVGDMIADSTIDTSSNNIDFGGGESGGGGASASW